MFTMNELLLFRGFTTLGVADLMGLLGGKMAVYPSFSSEADETIAAGTATDW
jgi:hypothetical protein